MIIRLEKPEDYRAVENLTREAFWNVYRPGCTEHFVLNRYRSNPDFIPELDFVMEEDGQLIGHEIALGRTISSFPYSLGSEPAGNELLGQEERDFLLLGKVVIMDMECAGQDKAGVLVKVDVPFHAQEADAHFAGFLQGILKQP